MSSDYSMTIGGLAELRSQLRRMQQGVDQTRTQLDDAGDLLTNYFSGQVFASRGGVLGESWPKLSDAYAARKARTFPGRPPMIRTGKLNQGFTYDITPERLRIRNTVEYFKYHQSDRERTKMPRRVMMKLTDQLKTDVTRVIDRKLTSGLRGA